MSEETRAPFLNPEESDFSGDEIKRYRDKSAEQAIKGLLGNKEKQPEKHMGYEKDEFIEFYKESEVPIAKKQRELLGMDLEEFIILKNFSQLSESERDEQMPKIVDSYKRNAKRGIEIKHQWLNSEITNFNKNNDENLPEFNVKDWVELMGFIPLYSDKDRMIREYESKEARLIKRVIDKMEKGEKIKTSDKKIAYFNQIRGNLGLSTGEFLDKIGLLPKQEAESKPNIIA